MTRLADLKGLLARLEELSERADALRPGLEAEATAGLDVVRDNTRLMREELDELLRVKPDIIADPNAGMTERELAILNRNVELLTALCNVLEAWLKEWEPGASQ